VWSVFVGWTSLVVAVVVVASALAAVFVVPVTMSSMASLGIVFLLFPGSLE
jgi:hypothetical protein